MRSLFRVPAAAGRAPRDEARTHGAARAGGRHEQAFEVGTFEYVRAGSEIALVRVEARNAGCGAASLVTADGERHDALPAAGEQDNGWHAAFAVSLSAIEGAQAELSLAFAGGETLVLGRPVERPLECGCSGTQAAGTDWPQRAPAIEAHDSQPAGAQGPAEPTTLEERLIDSLAALDDADAVRDQLERRCALAERGLAEFRDKLVQAWGESSELRELLDARERTHRESAEEARARREAAAVLRTALAAREHELGATRAEVERVCAELAGELAARGELERVTCEEREAAQEREGALRRDAGAALGEFERARDEVDSVRSLVERASAEAARASDAAAAAESELAEARVMVDEARASAEERAERVEQSERLLAQTSERFEAARAEAEQHREEARRQGEDADRQREEYESQVAALAESEAQLRAQLEALQSRYGRREGRRLGRRRRTEPAAADAPGASEHLEATITELRARIDELEREGSAQFRGSEGDDAESGARHAAAMADLHAALDACGAVEAELREALTSERQRNAEARQQLAALRGRLADRPQQDQPPRAPGWSAVDQDLIERIARAKSLAGMPD